MRRVLPVVIAVFCMDSILATFRGDRLQESRRGLAPDEISGVVKKRRGEDTPHVRSHYCDDDREK